MYKYLESMEKYNGTVEVRIYDNKIISNIPTLKFFLVSDVVGSVTLSNRVSVIFLGRLYRFSNGNDFPRIELVINPKSKTIMRLLPNRSTVQVLNRKIKSLINDWNKGELWDLI